MALDAQQPASRRAIRQATIELVEFPAQGSRCRGIVGPVDQQRAAPPAVALQPPGPTGRRQAGADHALVEEPAGQRTVRGRQGLGHGHGHGAVVTLQFPRQAQHGAAVGHGGQGVEPVQAGAASLRCGLQHPAGLRCLGGTEGPATRPHHGRLFGGDGGQGVAQVFAMVEADGPEADHGPLGMEGGGIETAPEAHLQHRQIHPLAGKAVEGRGGDQLEGGESVAAGEGLPAGQVGPQGGGGDPGVIDLDAFAPAHQMGER